MLKHDGRAFLTARREVTLARPTGRCTLAPPERIHGQYYLRLTVKDRPGVLARIAAIMAAQQVSIATVIQTTTDRPDVASLVLSTHDSNERAIQATIARLKKLPVVLEAPVLLRLANFKE